MKKVWTCLGGLVLVGIGLACLSNLVVVQTEFALLFGSVVFLYRVLPNVTISASGVFTAIVTVAGLTVGLHYFCSWLRRSIKPADDIAAEVCTPWKWQWTYVLLGVIVLMFTAGVAQVGLSHQVVWLATTRERLTEVDWDLPSSMLSKQNLRAVGVALHNHHEKHNRFPAGATFNENGEALYGWQVDLLPYLEQDALYQQVDRQRPWFHPANREVFRTRVPAFLHPQVDQVEDAMGYAVSHYAANGWVMSGGRPIRMNDVKDGSAHTLFTGEVVDRLRPWGDSRNWRDPQAGINQSPDGFGGPRGNGAQFLLMDGSVRQIPKSIDPAVLKALSTPAGGEPVGNGF